MQSLRRFEVQATCALFLALSSLLPLVMAAYLAIKRFDAQYDAIVYNLDGPFRLVYFACLVVALAGGGAAAVLGVNSAGQRRNDRGRQSWVGFFLGGTVVTASLVLVVAFLQLSQGLKLPPPPVG